MASTSSKHTEERQINTGRTDPCKRQLIGITLAASLILFIFAFSNAVWGPSIGPLARLLHTPVSQIQLLLELWGLGYIPGALVGGVFLDRYGPRAVFLTASLILAGGLLAFLLCVTFFPRSMPFALALLLIGIAGIGGGLIDSSTNGTMSSVYAKKRGIALNLFSLIYPVGGLLIALVDGGLLATFHNSPLPAFVFTLGFAFMALFSLLAIPKRFRIRHGTTSLKRTLKNAPALLRALAPIIAVMTLTSGVYVSIYTWLPNYLHITFGQAAAMGAFLSGAIWIADGLSRLGAATIISRFGSWRVTVLGIGVGLLGLILLACSPSAIFATAGFALAIAGIGPLYGTSLTIAGERTEQSLGSVTSLMLFSGAVFNLFYVWLFGFLLHTIGPLWPVLLSLALVIGSGLVALHLRPRHL